jgi:Mlc titration factor MtfA (ptsG expression regulator)
MRRACQPVGVPFWKRRPARRLPADWTRLMRTSLGEWNYLDEDERQRLGELITELLAGKSWEAARAFTLTDEMCTLIAAQAALMVLGLDLDAYREVRAVIVHPTTVTSRRPRPGPVAGVVTEEPLDLLGEAHQQRGPVLVAWDTASGDARHAGTGRNVVIHEFAHKLDMLDGMVDGPPPVAGRDAYDRWVSVYTAEYEHLRAHRHDPLLRRHAAQYPGELTAVATEVFFDQAADLAAHEPDLYRILSEFYGQDPKARRPST